MHLTGSVYSVLDLSGFKAKTSTTYSEDGLTEEPSLVYFSSSDVAHGINT